MTLRRYPRSSAIGSMGCSWGTACLPSLAMRTRTQAGGSRALARCLDEDPGARLVASGARRERVAVAQRDLPTVASAGVDARTGRLVAGAVHALPPFVSTESFDRLRSQAFPAEGLLEILDGDPDGIRAPCLESGSRKAGS